MTTWMTRWMMPHDVRMIADTTSITVVMMFLMMLNAPCTMGQMYSTANLMIAEITVHATEIIVLMMLNTVLMYVHRIVRYVFT